MIVPTARQLKPPIGKIQDIFLSATVKDLDEIRHELSAALRNARTVVHLQENWNRAAADVIHTCLDMLENSSGYLGVFGFFYGWVPEGVECSITELECIWARQRWSAVRPPPMFIFLPASPSRAEQKLLELADQALLRQFPDDAAKREECKRRQGEFVRRLCNEGSIVNFFTDVDDLKQRAISSILLWNQDLLEKKALRREVGASYLIPLNELGQIGRRTQLRALEDIIFERDERDDVPALCAIVGGARNSGLAAFTACLACWRGWSDLGREIEPGRPPREPYNVASLIKWAFSSFSDGSFTEANIEVLASAISQRLEHGPEVLLLQDLNSLDGGLEAFADFWSPLYAALTARWKKGSHRFSLIAMTRDPPATDHPAIWTNGAGARVDYSRILLLPALGPLTKEDVELWLDTHRVERAHRVAEHVIGTGVPVEVYDQLNAAGLWKQIIESRK